MLDPKTAWETMSSSNFIAYLGIGYKEWAAKLDAESEATRAQSGGGGAIA